MFFLLKFLNLKNEKFAENLQFCSLTMRNHILYHDIDNIDLYLSFSIAYNHGDDHEHAFFILILSFSFLLDSSDKWQSDCTFLILFFALKKI